MFLIGIKGVKFCLKILPNKGNISKQDYRIDMHIFRNPMQEFILKCIKYFEILPDNSSVLLAPPEEFTP